MSQEERSEGIGFEDSGEIVLVGCCEGIVWDHDSGYVEEEVYGLS